jgi:spermidine/putrescine transport system substrate-binding protein
MRGYLLLLFLTLLSARAENRLNLFIWSEYLPDSVVREFEQRFQCKVVIDLYEDAESMVAKIQNGGAAVYDVAVPADYTVPLLIREKLVAPLRKENIPNLKNLETKFVNPPYDPGNKYSAVYGWGVLGIYARKDSTKPLDESWGLFFDPAKQPGAIVLMDSMRDLIGAALKFRGYSFNSVSQKELREARDLLIDAKKRSAGFSTPVGGCAKVVEKSARAAIAYSADAVKGMIEDPDTYFFIPREGSQIFTDNLVVLSGARNRDLAEKFINFILEPEIGARISNEKHASCANAAAKKFLKSEIANNTAIHPPVEVLEKMEFLNDLGRNTRLYDQLWTSIKSR